MTAFIDEHRITHGVEPICQVLEIAPSSYYAARSRPPSARSVRDAELQADIGRIHRGNYAVYGYAALLDDGTYLASQRTMYRLLTANAEVRERRNQLRHPAYARPELLATGPGSSSAGTSPSSGVRRSGPTTTCT